MKKKWMKIVWIGALLLAAGCFRNTKSQIDLDIPAMKSEACARRITDALHALGEGAVIQISTNLDARSLQVTFDNVRLGRRNIEVAVRHAGFAVNDLPADEAVRATLPAECRGNE